MQTIPSLDHQSLLEDKTAPQLTLRQEPWKSGLKRKGTESEPQFLKRRRFADFCLGDLIFSMAKR